ncbi:MAG: 4-(cytidine 5'-diphospho)-2-C-methyl-D-erythritol kinase [Tissierellia bacterium]|nr:4-(cytidine 5'-diphospho)-2-C-methyl-D-erythritol kinase [Tissierellia bacterium]
MNKEIILDSYAKINLSLDVLDKRDDGYHDIITIFQEIDLRDGIYIKQKPGGELILTCDYKLLPIDEDNTLYRAWDLMKEYYEGDPGIRAHIEKNIPIAAGLAGGSSNAAAMIKGLNQLWELNLSEEKLVEIGSKIGADVPFFFMGGTALGVGKGDELSGLESFSGRNILIVNTGYGVSTKYVYKNYSHDPKSRIDFDNIVKTINNGDDEGFYPLISNKLEDVTIKIQPEISEIKENMKRLGARATLMCGSGPTVFGIYDDYNKLQNAFFYFKDKYDLVFSCETR